MKENPYRLATDIFGIGFVTADRIAEKLGIAHDASIRVEAGILYLLNQCADEGHVFYPYEPLVSKGSEILGVEREAIVRALGTLAVDQKIVVEDSVESLSTSNQNRPAVYLSRLHLCETGIARRIIALQNARRSIRDIDPAKAIEWIVIKPKEFAEENPLISCISENLFHYSF